MISLNDLFPNEYLFSSEQPSAQNGIEDETYIPSSDILPLSSSSTDMTASVQPSASQLSADEQQLNSSQTNHSNPHLNSMLNENTDNEHSDIRNDQINNMDNIRKHNHSEIEKKRREKMNWLIKEMAQLVPMCNAIPSQRKLDKLTVLRMTVQHVKAVKNSVTFSDSTATQTPNYISKEIIDKTLLQMTEGFLFVVSCDRGKILYVSDSVEQTLNYNKRDLLGISWFDVLHHRDIPKVKEQLSLWDSAPKEHLVDSKTLLPLDECIAPINSTRLQSSSGSRRSFFCRMKYKFYLGKNDGNVIKGLTKKKRRRINIMNDKYCDLYCMGYLKSWQSAGAEDLESGDSAAGANTGCLIAMARVMPQISPMDRQPTANSRNFPIKPIEYMSRHAMDGIYLFVDQRVTTLLGYLPQELLGTSCYDYCHPDDMKTLAESHRRALQQDIRKNSLPYRFRTKVGTYLYIKTLFKTFKNPWTREFEYLIAINENVVTPDVDSIKNYNNNCHTIEAKKPTKVETKSNITTNSKNSYENQSQNLMTSSPEGPVSSSGSTGSGSSLKSELSSHSNGSQGSDTSIMNRFIKNQMKYSKIGQQIAEEILETQRRADDFSSSSSQSSNSPPSDLDSTANNSSVNSSMSGSVSSNSSNDKSMTSAYGLKSGHQNSKSVTPSDSGIENNSFDDNLSLLSIPSLSNASLADISALDSMPMNGIQFLEPNNQVLLNQRHSNNVFNSNHNQPNGANVDEAAMSLIMSILEADAGLGGPVDFSSMPWPLY